MNTLEQHVDDNLALLKANPYPGRGIIMGQSEDGQHLVQVYWIMGRSENSRNRVFNLDNGRLFTEAADPSKMKDPSLTIYNAMAERDRRFFVVSNGHQTDDVLAKAQGGTNLFDLLFGWSYEPDEPNWTPRITGIFDLHKWHMCELASIWRAGNGETRKCAHFEPMMAGFGKCITTYTGDGNPLPSFTSDPFLLPLLGDQMTIVKNYWGALNTDNRVALAVKFIAHDGRSETTIINRFEKVQT